MMRPSHVGRVLLVTALGAPGTVGAQAVVTNSLGMEFVRIEPGTVTVGRFQPTCPTPPPPGAELERRHFWTQEDYRRCEEMVRMQSRPGFEVEIDAPFYLGRYEVTQEEWERVMGANPSYFQGDRVAGDAGRHPVESVTWADAQRFVERLNALDPTAEYRLPTEFEWEYAARAGAREELSWAEIRQHAWIGLVDKGTTRPVGMRDPNAWGLHDMLGNVWEWVADFHNGETFPDPTPPASGDVHVLRGGSFLSDVKNATYGTHAGGPGNGWDVGFRIVRQD